MKSDKRLIALTSLFILLPVCAGVPDGWSGKPFAVFGMPLFLLAVHLVCAFAVFHDPKADNVVRKIRALTLWICPAVSLFVAALTYSYALGNPVNPTFFAMLFMGALFVVVGNYLPKCRQNYTVGIKLPWTLADEDNWNRTHRMAGPLWAAGGFLILLDAFLQIYPLWLFCGIPLVAVLAPVVYSAALYLKKRGQA